MSAVYVLHHVRKDDEYGDNAKMIGVYSSKEAADAAIGRLRHQPGFRDYPEGFSINRYALDEDHWKEGFVDLSDGH
jgi:homoserine kinase type II